MTSPRIIIFIFISIILCLPRSARSEGIKTFIKSDFRHDVLDYDQDRVETFLRGRVKLTIAEKLTFNYCEIKNFSTGSRSRTGSLYIVNLRDHVDFIAGNYNTAFGSGLIMGKRVYMPPDPFRSRLAVSKAGPLSPASGGNPAYSFFGSSMRLHCIFGQTELSLLPFYSIQRRYISLEDEEKGAVISSISGLDSRAVPDDNHGTPVDVINMGSMFSLDIKKTFLFQTYIFKTDLKYQADDNILWDSGKNGSSDGTDSLTSAGCFMQYADSNVCIFIEPALSRREDDEPENAYAAQWGMNFKTGMMSLSYTGKKTGRDFYSPYSSGGKGPENIWQITSSLKPSKYCRFGIDLYEDKDLAPSYNSSCIEGTRREGIFASIRPGQIFKVDLKLRRLSHYSEEYEDGRIQAGISTSLEGERLFFRIKYTVQDSEEDKMSDIISMEIKYLFMERLSLMAGWTAVRISGDNRIYGAIPPASESTASGRLFSSSGQACALKFKYKAGKDFVSARFGMTDQGDENEKKFESALGFLF